MKFSAFAAIFVFLNTQFIFCNFAFLSVIYKVYGNLSEPNISPKKRNFRIKKMPQTVKAYFSPGNDCLDAIIRSLDAAVSSIDICVFTISDNRISDAIIFAHRRGIRVRIISDNDKLNDAGSDIEELANAGIPVRIDRTPNHMHHKFAVIDKKKIITGSYNWTRSAALYNHENILISLDEKYVKSFVVEFEKLWREMVEY